MENKIPFVYSISSFLLCRPFEIIRNYVNNEKICVKMIGSGRGKDYGNLGFSHWSEDDKEIMNCFKNIKSCWPKDENELNDIFFELVNSKQPFYLNLKK